jgi:hypothetical protein
MAWETCPAHVSNRKCQTSAARTKMPNQKDFGQGVWALGKEQYFRSQSFDIQTAIGTCSVFFLVGHFTGNYNSFYAESCTIELFQPRHSILVLTPQDRWEKHHLSFMGATKQKPYLQLLNKRKTIIIFERQMVCMASI